jgi:hypothetical protein
MLHAAIHDAVVTIDHSGLRYLTRVHTVQGRSPFRRGRAGGASTRRVAARVARASYLRGASAAAAQA